MVRPEPMDLGIGVTSGVDAQMLCADIFVSRAIAARLDGTPGPAQDEALRSDGEKEGSC